MIVGLAKGGRETTFLKAGYMFFPRESGGTSKVAMLEISSPQEFNGEKPLAPDNTT